MAVSTFDDDQAVRPTTPAQVSGHRFLRRRVEHGLVFGDIRMIHDPLGSRRRAMLFGVVACALVGLGAGLLAWLSPNPDPGEATVVRDTRGQLYVQLEGTLHPVANLTSAQLIAGSPEEPASIGDDVLAGRDKGVPVGIPGAPGVTTHDAPAHWAACTDPGEGTVTVVATAASEPLPPGDAALVRHEGIDWLLTAEGRRALPDDNEALGRVLRRHLGVGASTPHLQLLPEVLGVTPELPVWEAPGGRIEILQAGEQRFWLREGALTPLTSLQAQVLEDLGASLRGVERAELADYPDSELPGPHLPAETLSMGAQACVGAEGANQPGEIPAAVTLSGEGVADRFATEVSASVAVDTGSGYFVVGSSGTRHAVDAEGLAALGLSEPVAAPWEVLRLLPEGAPLAREQALAATY